MKLEVEALPESVTKALRDAVCGVLRAQEVQGACGFAISIIRAKGSDHTIASTAAAVPFPSEKLPQGTSTTTTIMHLACITEQGLWQAIADGAAHEAMAKKGGTVH